MRQESTDPTLIDQLGMFTQRATETEASVAFCDLSQGRIASFQGKLRGPHCMHSRTLPASFPIPLFSPDAAPDGGCHLQITDPCYWTPALPFLYELQLEVAWNDGSTTTGQHALGLRRWEAVGPSFVRERRRVVLRGTCAERLTADLLEAASEAEVTLLVPKPEEELLRLASQMGASLLLDLRGSGDIDRELARLGWFPAVEGVFVDETRKLENPIPSNIQLGTVASAERPKHLDPRVSFYAVELSDDSCLPPWAVESGCPVIAIRRAGDPSNLVAARHGCDRLQSDLAPDFDLAGYFV